MVHWDYSTTEESRHHQTMPLKHLQVNTLRFKRLDLCSVRRLSSLSWIMQRCALFLFFLLCFELKWGGQKCYCYCRRCHCARSLTFSLSCTWESAASRHACRPPQTRSALTVNSAPNLNLSSCTPTFLSRLKPLSSDCIIRVQWFSHNLITAILLFYPNKNNTYFALIYIISE